MSLRRHFIRSSKEKRSQGLALSRDFFKIRPVALGCTLLMLASGAAAQNTLDTVTVTGIRRGIEAAMSVKKNSGRELVSTGDNRSVEFDQYPSELLSGVTVYKTPDAGLVGQGLSGTLDMQTVRPRPRPGCPSSGSTPSPTWPWAPATGQPCWTC